MKGTMPSPARPSVFQPVSALLLAALMSACAGAPEVRFHSLLAADAPTTHSAMPTQGAPLRLVIAGIKVPAAVDQPQWLVRRSDDTLQALEQDRWASPLADEFRAAMRDGLTLRWGVVEGVAPVPVLDAVAPSWSLVLEVLRLDARPGRETLLEARWTLVPPRTGAAALTCTFRVIQPVAGEGTVPLAAAHRRAVLQLIDAIGRQLRALDSTGAGACAAAAA